MLPCFIGYHFEFARQRARYFVKRAIDHKSSPREILDKLLNVLI